MGNTATALTCATDLWEEALDYVSDLLPQLIYGVSSVVTRTPQVSILCRTPALLGDPRLGLDTFSHTRRGCALSGPHAR